MILHLPLSAFEPPPLILIRIPFKSLAFYSRPPPHTLSPLHRLRFRSLHPPSLASSIRNEEADLNASAELEEDAASPEDLDCIREIKRVLELLKKNRDMQFGEVQLTVMIEDPRDVERKRLLGIEDPGELTRDDLASALEIVHEGRIPKNRVALRLLAEEMISWPDLEVEAPKKKPIKSQYARATDTGVDPREAAKRLNIDWDSAADIEAEDEDEDIEVPPAVGYGALYLVTALPLIIGVSVILILFYNSLQ